MPYRLLGCVCLLFLLLPTSLYASEEAEVEEEEEVEVQGDTVTTTARAPMAAFATDRSVDRVDEDDIFERQSDSITDAIAEEPGVYRQATNRGSDTVYLRGLIGPENLILVDGIRFNQATFRTGPNQYLATLDPWALDRIEVVRGPGSILYGSGAMGGVVQLFPRTIPDQNLSGRAIVSYASADHMLGGAADAGLRHGSFASTGGLSLRNHQTLRPGTRGNEEIFLAAEQDGRILASEYRQSFWRFGSEVDLGDDLDFKLHYLGGLIEDARRTDQLGRGQMRSADNRDDIVYGRLTIEDTPFADEVSVFGAYHRTDETTRRYQCAVDQNDGPALVSDLRGCAALERQTLTDRRDLRDVVHTLGAGITAVTFVGAPVRLSYGAEAYRDQVSSTRDDAVMEDSTGSDFAFQRADRGNFAHGSTYATMGTFAHAEVTPWYSGDQEIVLNGGARVEHFRAFAPDVTENLGDVEFSNTGLVGGLGISYLLGSNLNLYLNWNQGFRAPNLQESTVLGDTGNFFEIPNPDLGPERNDTFELGTKLNAPSVGQLSASLFTSLIRNRITGVDGEFQGQTEIDDKPIRVRVNADRAYFYGAEAGLRSATIFGLELFGNVAWIDGAVQTDETDPRFDPGPLHNLLAGDLQWTHTRRLPPLQFLTGLTFKRFENWSATLYVEGAGSQTRLSSGDLNDLRICEITPGVLYGDEAQPCPGTPAWTTLNLRGSYQLDELLRVNLALTNLTDQRYQHHGSGVLGAGLQGMATVTGYY